jgi:hypothetical protein
MTIGSVDIKPCGEIRAPTPWQVHLEPVAALAA